MSNGRISDEVLEDVKACLVDKKNPTSCIDKALESHGLSPEDKARVLTKVAKRALE